MITVTLYHTAQCEECEQILTDLQGLQQSIPHQLININIDEDPTLYKAFNGNVPLVQVGPYHLHSPITKQDLQVAMGAATDRYASLNQMGDKTFQQRIERGRNVSGADRLTYWLSKNYMALINLLLFIYAGLPFLAPVLMKNGITAPARVIYAVYSPLCHQLTFRSFFLFGEQPYYPRELAHVPGVMTYEQLTKSSTIDLTAARQFIGNETVGYKVALCERDVAIYGAMLLFGLVFMLTGRRIKPLPWYIWLFIGLIPIGVDGVSQLPSLLQGIFPGWVLMRESTPFLRVLTGSLFGLTTAWYIFPLIEETMLESRRIYARKFAISSQPGVEPTVKSTQ